jgi:hypothetical protein
LTVARVPQKLTTLHALRIIFFFAATRTYHKISAIMNRRVPGAEVALAPEVLLVEQTAEHPLERVATGH